MSKRVFVLFLSLSLSLFANPDDEGEGTTIFEGKDLTSEQSFFVDITLNNGMVYLERGATNKIFEGEFVYSNQPPEIDYEIVGDEGRLTIHFDDEEIRQKGENRFKKLTSLNDLYDNECHVKLSPDLPITLNLDLGVVKGELRLGGLQLKEINFTSGVSKTNINFDEPNPIALEYFDVEAGVGTLEIYNLGNANFKRFNFEGGIGDYVIDFAGNHYGDTKVNVDVGLGKVKLYLPRSAGIRMKVDKSFLCSFDIDEIYKENDIYYNQKWGKTDNSLDMNVETGVGKISVVWIEN